MTFNERTIKTNFKRIDLCDLMIACTMLEIETGAKKWSDLHDKIENLVSEFDKEHEKELLAELERI